MVICGGIDMILFLFNFLLVLSYIFCINIYMCSYVTMYEVGSVQIQADTYNLDLIKSRNVACL